MNYVYRGMVTALGMFFLWVAMVHFGCFGCAPLPERSWSPAFHMAQHADVGEDLSDYGIIIWNSNVDPDLATAHAQTALASVNLELVPLYGEEGSTHAAQREVMLRHIRVSNLDGKWVRHPRHNAVFVQPSIEAARDLATYTTQYLSDFDGVYVDNCFALYPEYRWASLGEESDYQSRWAAYRDEFMRILAEELGKPVVANVGKSPGQLSPSFQSWGISIEAEHVTNRNLGEMLAAFRRFDSRWNIAWKWEAEGARDGVIR